jgi:hypothetical protein
MRHITNIWKGDENLNKTNMGIFVTLLFTFVLLMVISNPSYALTNSISAKKQITKASVSVAKVEKNIKNKNFNPVIASKELDLAIKEVSKIKSLRKTYNSSYNLLLKRISMIKKRILDRRLAIVNKTLVTEAETAVIDAECIISAKNIAVVRDKSNTEASSKTLTSCQNTITKALNAVGKLDRYSDKYKELLRRLDTINAMLSEAMSYCEFES